MKNIVVVEDDSTIRELVEFNLQKAGFQVHAFDQGLPALDHLRRHGADLLVLDLMLPDIGGLEICQDIRRAESTAHIPIVILTAKGDEVDRILGLEIGADDYVVKPFSPRELVARIKAVMRRTEEPHGSDVITHGELLVDVAAHRVSVAGKEVGLTATEFRILELLARHPGRVYDRNSILDVLDRTVLDRNIDVHVTNLRRKLGKAGEMIKTMRGVGYKLTE